MISFSAKLRQFNNFQDIIIQVNYSIIFIFIFPIILAFILIYLRKLLNMLNFTNVENPNNIVNNDLIAFLQTLIVLLIGLITFLIPPANISIIDLLNYIVIAVISGLNTFFLLDWQKKICDSLTGQLEHNQWIQIFNNSCIVFLITFTGIITNYSFFIYDKFGSNNSFVKIKIYLDGFIIIYNSVGSPILWLLRPIYKRMIFIRNSISKPVENYNI